MYSGVFCGTCAVPGLSTGGRSPLWLTLWQALTLLCCLDRLWLQTSTSTTAGTGKLHFCWPALVSSSCYNLYDNNHPWTMIFISVYLLHFWLVPSKVLRKMLKRCKNENVHTMWQVPLCWFCSTNLFFVKSPITLGSTVVLESSLDKKEGKKTFVSCKVTSSDGAKLHTEATGNLFWGAAPVWCWQCVSIK